MKISLAKHFNERVVERNIDMKHVAAAIQHGKIEQRGMNGNDQDVRIIYNIDNNSRIMIGAFIKPNGDLFLTTVFYRGALDNGHK